MAYASKVSRMFFGVLLGIVTIWQVSAVVWLVVYSRADLCNASPRTDCITSVPAIVVERQNKSETRGGNEGSSYDVTAYSLRVRAQNGDEVHLYGDESTKFDNAGLSNESFQPNKAVILYRWRGEYVRLSGGDDGHVEPVTVNVDNWSPERLVFLVTVTLPISAALVVLVLRPLDVAANRKRQWDSAMVVTTALAGGSLLVVVLIGHSVLLYMYQVFL